MAVLGSRTSRRVLALGLQFPDVVHARTRLPLATYRLQFNSRFTFGDARRIVDYLHTLGISDAYTSSYLRAVPGSPHGYDVADPTRLNPEIGSDEDYWTWIGALRARDMGHVLDVVPNHMGIAQSANPWWLDVLENGPSSRFAHFFDIDWSPVKVELRDKVLIPILGDQYGEVLERQELTLAIADGAFAVHYYDDTLPIAPDTYPLIFSADLDAWLSNAGDMRKRTPTATSCRASSPLPPICLPAPRAMQRRSRSAHARRKWSSGASRHSPIAATTSRS